MNVSIDSLWNYLQSFILSDKSSEKNKKWLTLLTRSNLNLSLESIKKMIQDPNKFFEYYDYKDFSINHLQLYKVKYFIILLWLGYLYIDYHKVNNYQVKDNTELKIYLQELLDLVLERKKLLIKKRDNIFKNISELERLKSKVPNLDKTHLNKLENQIKILRVLLNLEIEPYINKLIKLLEKQDNFDKIKDLGENYGNLINKIEDYYQEIKTLRMELLNLNYPIENNIFSQNIDKLIRFHPQFASYKKQLLNPNSWMKIDELKLMELEINNIDTQEIKEMIENVDNLSINIYQNLIDYQQILNLDNVNKINNFDNEIKKLIIKINDKKNKDEMSLKKLEKEYNITELKDIDLEFYYQFYLDINKIIKNYQYNDNLRIDKDMYQNNNLNLGEENIDKLINRLKDNFVTREEFRETISRIENRIDVLEDDREFLFGSLIIAIYGFYLWKDIINVKKKINKYLV